jgi:hypothetical protein
MPRWLCLTVPSWVDLMCEDYPCCGHTPADPCGSAGATANDYLLAWSKRGMPDDYYEEY